MSDVIVFTNPGLIDLRGITTFGVNAKDGDNPIGFFGTGLKYAIAVLLRTGHEVTMWRGKERYHFKTEVDSVRGKEFGFITMGSDTDKTALGFTTELGKKWEVWQAFRELYSNALDENGAVYRALALPQDNITQFVVRGAAFAKVYKERARYFLRENKTLPKPLVQCEYGDVFNRTSGTVYYRGIAVGDLPKPAIFTYDTKQGVELTEDRTMRNPYMLTWLCARMLGQCEDEGALRRVFTASSDTFESTIEFTSLYHVGDVFKATLLAMRGSPNLTAAARRALAHFHTIGEAEPMVAKPLVHESKMIARAKEALQAAGYEVTQVVEVTTALADNCLGLAFRPTEKIFLSRSVFNQGQTRVTSTLFEEYLHLHYNLEDESRGMQNFLLDLAVALMERQA